MLLNLYLGDEMSEVKRIEIDHESGIVRCSEGKRELLKCHKNQVGISNSEELVDFIKSVGGVKNAVARMQVLISD